MSRNHVRPAGTQFTGLTTKDDAILLFHDLWGKLMPQDPARPLPPRPLCFRRLLTGFGGASPPPLGRLRSRSPHLTLYVMRRLRDLLAPKQRRFWPLGNMANFPFVLPGTCFAFADCALGKLQCHILAGGRLRSHLSSECADRLRDPSGRAAWTAADSVCEQGQLTSSDARHPGPD